jgi:chemotaxis protein CheC
MHITSEQVDVLQELINIGIGSSAGSLNHMLGTPIQLKIPAISVGTIKDLLTKLTLPAQAIVSSVQLPFQGAFAGSAYLFFPADSATALVSTLTGEAETTIRVNSVKEATLTEIGNIVLNAVVGSLGNGLQHHIRYSIPFYQEIPLTEIIQTTPSDASKIILLAQTQFRFSEYDISGNIMLMIGLPDVKILLSVLNSLSPDFIY